MKGKVFAAALALACAGGLASLAAPALASDVGVSISIGQPGFYGRIEIGDYPRPQLIYREPVIIERVVSQRSPVYLNVPPGHAKKWSKHCAAYNACGVPVYFVNNSWYEREYVPRYQARHAKSGGEGKEKHGGEGKEKRGGDRGHGKGNKN